MSTGAGSDEIVHIVMNVGGEAVGAPRAPSAVVSELVAAERDGFTEAWSVHFSRSSDSLATIAAATSVTTEIALGVGVVPSFPRHPAALAQSALTVQALSGGRFTLGVGVSHRPVIEGMHGLDYSDPLGHLREYLTVLRALLTTGHVSHAGTFYRTEISVTVPDTTPVPVLVGALSPGMSRLAGELAEGVVTWLAGPRSLEQVIGPAVRAAATDAGRPAPRVVAALPVAVDDDVDRARAAAGEIFGRYAGLPNYQRLFAREGVNGAAELAVVGDASAVRTQLEAVAAAGATDVWAVQFDTGAGTDETRSVLAALGG